MRLIDTEMVCYWLFCAGEVAIKVIGDFTWDPDKPPTLTGLNLHITKGQLVAVVGPTGSGKTSLM
jgi:ABC-type bacteriocin/lantibiotic exporter with double-glycine peptidase domain